MKQGLRFHRAHSVLAAGLLSCGLAAAQYTNHPGQIPDPSSYKGSMELQRREQQNALPPSSSSQGSALPAGPGSTGGAVAARLDQARQAWLKRPPLAPAHNPLLGAWTRPQVRGDPNDPFAQIGALMKGGLCEVFFSGDAVFEFRPAVLVGIDKRSRQAETLDQVEYRGDARHVVVIPRTILKLIEFDFDGPDRIRWTGQNCTLGRVGGSSAAKLR